MDDDGFLKSEFWGQQELATPLCVHCKRQAKPKVLNLL